MVDRIKQVMEHYEETPATFAEKLGVNRSNLTHLFSGRNQPSLEFAKKVLSAYPEVRTEWLIMGVGEMIKDPAQEFVPPKKTFIQTDLFEMDDETTAEVEDEATEMANPEGDSQQKMDENVVSASKTDSSVAQPASVEVTSDVNGVKPLPATPNHTETVETRSNVVMENMTQNPVQPIENKIVEPKNAVQTSAVESKNQNIPTTTQEIINSQPVVGEPAVDMMMASQHLYKVAVPSNSETPKRKKVEKIIFFYDDDTFKIFYA